MYGLGRRKILRFGDLITDPKVLLWRKRNYDMNPYQIYIVLTPEFEGYFNGKSLPAYGRMGKVAMTTETAR